jgi:tRNA(Arg) A34 adenosine deaminase TadA
MEDQNNFIEKAVELSEQGSNANKGGPFGAVVVKDGVIIGFGYNQVTSTNDPTAHAEIVAIREACKSLNTFQLTGCEIYTSCEPCPMCLGAIYWARPDKVFYANTRFDAAAIGFDDSFIYNEINLELADRKIPMIKIESENAKKVFNQWKQKENKIDY